MAGVDGRENGTNAILQRRSSLTYHWYYLHFQFLPDMIDQFEQCPDIDKCLARLSDDDRIAVATTANHAKSSPSIDNDKLYCFDDRVHFHQYPVAMFARTNYPLWSTVNQHLKWAVEGGLIAKWRRDESQTHKSQSSKRKSRTRLTNGHVFFAWALYFLMGSGAIIIFISEHVIYPRRDGGRIWQLLHLAVNDDRLFLRPKRFSNIGEWFEEKAL